MSNTKSWEKWIEDHLRTVAVPDLSKSRRLTIKFLLYSA